MLVFSPSDISCEGFGSCEERVVCIGTPLILLYVFDYLKNWLPYRCLPFPVRCISTFCNPPFAFGLTPCSDCPCLPIFYCLVVG